MYREDKLLVYTRWGNETRVKRSGKERKREEKKGDPLSGADEFSNYYSIIMRVAYARTEKFRRTRAIEHQSRQSFQILLEGGGRRINIDNVFSVPFRENEPASGAHKPLLYCYYDGQRRR